MTGEGVDFFGIKDGGPEVVDAVTEGAVDAVLDAVSARIGLVHARGRLEVPQMISPLRIARRPVQKRTVVAIRTDPGRLVVTRAIHVGGITGIRGRW